MSLLKSLNDFFGERGPTESLEQIARREASEHTVLVVDDDKDFLNSCAEFLREAGYNVLKSSTGAKGLNMLRYAPKDISLVLLDYDMPELDGSDTLQFLRKMTPAMKVGAVSGLDETMLPASFREHVDQLLSKPFRREELLVFVRGLLTAPTHQPVATPALVSAVPAIAG